MNLQMVRSLTGLITLFLVSTQRFGSPRKLIMGGANSKADIPDRKTWASLLFSFFLNRTANDDSRIQVL